MIEVFTKEDYKRRCQLLASGDPQLQQILEQHGYPPRWRRSATFLSLVHIILEQQVSLTSARAALMKLKLKLGTVTPKKLLALTDAELRACYFSRQKIIYVRDLASAIESGRLRLKDLQYKTDDEVRTALKMIKGIGDWTADIYLLFVLHRADVFPTGDLAMMNALKQVKELPAGYSKDEIIKLAEAWRPQRSLATMFLWHHYLETRKRNGRTKSKKRIKVD